MIVEISIKAQESEVLSINRAKNDVLPLVHVYSPPPHPHNLSLLFQTIYQFKAGKGFHKFHLKVCIACTIEIKFSFHFGLFVISCDPAMECQFLMLA